MMNSLKSIPLNSLKSIPPPFHDQVKPVDFMHTYLFFDLVWFQNYYTNILFQLGLACANWRAILSTMSLPL